MEIGVRELKARLSEYLECAARGEHLTVTDRGKPRAVLGPLPGGDNVARGIAEGWITAPQAPGPCRRRRRGLAPRSPSKT
jgi:prevent-host-death family protein